MTSERASERAGEEMEVSGRGAAMPLPAQLCSCCGFALVDFRSFDNFVYIFSHI